MAPTIYEVAQRARVSTATVSRALNGTAPVAARTLRRIAAAIEELGYEPNRVARSLVTSATDTIAILLPDITNPFFPDLVKGAQLLADERHYTLLLLNTESDGDREDAYLRTLRGKQIDGVILVGVVMSGDHIRRILGEERPIVVLDRMTDLAPQDATAVQLNHGLGAELAVQHLLDLGHRAIAHVTGPQGLPLVRQRAAGYRSTLRRAGIAPTSALVSAGDFTEEGGYRATLRLLRRGIPFSAIFAANDLSAVGAMAALEGDRLHVPDDVSVVGFDDIHLSSYTTPGLTTIRQPTYEMGRRAAEVLIDRIERAPTPYPPIIMFEPELVVRRSTAAPGRTAKEVG